MAALGTRELSFFIEELPLIFCESRARGKAWHAPSFWSAENCWFLDKTGGTSYGRLEGAVSTASPPRQRQGLYLRKGR